MSTVDLLPRDAIAGGALVKRFYVQRSQHADDVLRRFAQFAVVRISLHIAASFGIEQDRLDNGAHVSARATATLRVERIAVVIEDFRDPFNVGATRVAGDEMLNQLLANKRTDVGCAKILSSPPSDLIVHSAWLPAPHEQRNRYSVQQRLCAVTSWLFPARGTIGSRQLLIPGPIAGARFQPVNSFVNSLTVVCE